MILRLAILIQYRRVTHTHTDGHTMMARPITRASLAPRWTILGSRDLFKFLEISNKISVTVQDRDMIVTEV